MFFLNAFLVHCSSIPCKKSGLTSFPRRIQYGGVSLAVGFEAVGGRMSWSTLKYTPSTGPS